MTSAARRDDCAERSYTGQTRTIEGGGSLMEDAVDVLRGRPAAGCCSYRPARCSPPGVPQTDRAMTPARVIAETRAAMGGDGQARRDEDARRHRPHASGARRQPRADRVRDPGGAARQVRAARRVSRAGRRPDGHRIQRRAFVQSPAPQPPPARPGGPPPPTPQQLEARRACSSSPRSRTSPV